MQFDLLLKLERSFRYSESNCTSLFYCISISHFSTFHFFCSFLCIFVLHSYRNYTPQLKIATIPQLSLNKVRFQFDEQFWLQSVRRAKIVLPNLLVTE